MGFDPSRILEALEAHEVGYVVVGGMALVLQGSARITNDLDICYDREPLNLDRLARALAPLTPYLRGAPAGLPFRLDAPTLAVGLNFTLVTDAGPLDLLGEMSGVGDFAAAARAADWMEVFGRRTRVLNLDGLERAKRAAGRTKDLLDLDEIAEIRKLKDSGNDT